MQMAPVAMYAFGYGKYAACLNRLRRSRAANSSTSGGCALHKGELLCDGYSPHVSAIALLLAIAASKAPAFYALGMLYHVNLNHSMPYLGI